MFWGFLDVRVLVSVAILCLLDSPVMGTASLLRQRSSSSSKALLSRDSADFSSGSKSSASEYGSVIFQVKEEVQTTTNAINTEPKNHARILFDYTNDPSSLIMCRVTLMDTTYQRTATQQGYQTDEVACIPLRLDDNDTPNITSDDVWVDNIETHYLLPLELPGDIFLQNERAIEAGSLIVAIEGAHIRRRKGIIVLKNNANFTVVGNAAEVDHHYEFSAFANQSEIPGQDSPAGRKRRLLRRLQTIYAYQKRSIGTRRVMIVRVSTLDSQPENTLSEIIDGLFVNKPNFQSQYQACSFGQLNWELAEAVDLTLNRPISNFTSGSAVVQAAVNKILKRKNTNNILSLADNFMFCVAPGTPGWIAVAGVNYWRSAYQSGWCLSLSATMHEMGHNLGLIHSGAGMNFYGDESGYMGYGDSRLGYPLKCFNGVKSHQLGWYETREWALNVTEQPYRIFLASFVDFAKTTTDQPVLLSIDSFWYLQYNQAKGFNNETEEHGNMVTVTADVPGNSKSLAGLAVGDNYTIFNFRNFTGQSLVIEVCKQHFAGAGSQYHPDGVTISVALDRSYCNDTEVPTHY